MDAYATTLDACKNPIRIAQQFTEDGKRRYFGFDSFVDAARFVKKNKHLSLHEVTRCGDSGVQRIFIDIDAKEKDFGHIPKKSINIAGNLLVTTAKDILYSRGITNVDFVEMVSHRADKYSKHVVFTCSYIDTKHYDCFYNTLVAEYSFNLEMMNLPHELVNMIDKKVYGKHHCLRLHTSFKYGSDVRLEIRNPATGIVEKNGEFDVNTMVTYIPLDQSTMQIYKCQDGCNGPAKVIPAIIADNHIKMAEIVLNSMSDEGISVLRLNGCYFRLSIDHSKPCPVCGNKHDHENAFAVVSTKDVKIICRRKQKGDPNRFRVVHTFDKYVEDVPGSVENIPSIQIKETKSDYLGPIDDVMESCDRLLLRSDMGSAKSSRLYEYISRQIALNTDFTCIIVTYRVNLAAGIHSATNKLIPDGIDPFELYSDIKTSKISINEHKRLVIQLESLHRINYDIKGQIDLVVIDECVSFCQQNVSGLNKNKIAANQMNLKNIIKNSKKTIMIDALLNTTTVETYKCLLHNDRHLFWDNTAVNLWSPEVVVYNDVTKWRKQLSDDLKAGEKIYTSTTNGEVPIKQLDRYLTKLNPDIKSLLIYGGGEDNQRIICNINEELVKYDHVIASPCMSAGVSFDVKNYFDKVYMYIDNYGPTAVDIIQSSRRIRHTKTNKIIICNVSGQIQLPTTYDDVFRVEQERLKFNSQNYINCGFSVDINRDEFYFSNADSPGLKWWLNCIRIVNLNNINKFNTIINYLKSKGANITATINKDEDEDGVNAAKWDRSTFKEDGIIIKKTIHEEIADARIISEAEYEALNNHGRYYLNINHDTTGIIAAENDSLLMKKFQLLRHYGLHEDLFPENNKKIRTKPFNDSSFIETYSSDSVMKCYKEIIYRDLTDDQVAEIDRKATEGMTDEEKTKHKYLFGRHVTINKIKELIPPGGSDYEPVMNIVTEFYKTNNPLFKRTKSITEKILVSSVNKILSPYGYKVCSNRIRIGENRKRVLLLEDYSSELFIIKTIPFNSSEIAISAVQQSGTSEKPVAVIYSI